MIQVNLNGIIKIRNLLNYLRSSENKYEKGEIFFKAGDLDEFPAGLYCEWEVTKSTRKHYRLGS